MTTRLSRLDRRFVGLSCYTSNLACYLAQEFADTEARLAESVRLAVRTDLPDGMLAFSHHRYALNRMPDGTHLVYATAERPAEVVRQLQDEVARHGRCLVVADNAKLSWSPSYRSGHAAPHWLLIDESCGDSSHVVDAFSGLLRSGEQHPYEGWLSTAELLAAMTPPVRWTPEQDRRNELACGFPWPPPEIGGCVWLRRDADSGGEAGGGGEAELPGNWLFTDDAVLQFLGGYFVERGAEAQRHLDDLWTAARHRAFQHRWRSNATTLTDQARQRMAEAFAAWDGLPAALRFAVDSARRGRPRDSLIRRTFDHLLRLEIGVAATDLPTSQKGSK